MSLQIGCKVATTKYFDREKISSSHQEINDSKKTDMEIQAKWVFYHLKHTAGSGK